MRAFSKKTSTLLYAALGLLLLLLVWAVGTWQMQSQVAIAKSLSPTSTFSALYRLLMSHEIFPHILSSLKRVAVGLSIALFLGVPVGLLLGLSPKTERISSGAFQLLRMISPLSWMPVVVIILGIGDAPIYFLLSFAAIWSIILNTAAGVKSIDPQWLKLGKTLNATRFELLRFIIFPAILIHIATGLRLAIGVVWIVLVPCEMLGVSSGLGYFILDTRDRFAYDELMAAIIIIGALGWGLDTIAKLLVKNRLV